MRQIPQYDIQHNYEEENQAAGGLTNPATDVCQLGNLTTIIWNHTTLSFLNQVVINDYMGKTYPLV